METFSLQTEDKELVATMRRGVSALVTGKPEDWNLHLRAIFAVLDLTFKIGDFDMFNTIIAGYGAKCALVKMAMIAEGKLDDDCDCQRCANRRKYQKFMESAEGKAASETFQRYYTHLMGEASHHDEELVDGATALEEWSKLSTDDKMIRSETSYWNYAKEGAQSKH